MQPVAQAARTHPGFPGLLALVALACFAPRPARAEAPDSIEVRAYEVAESNDSIDLGIGFGPVFPVGSYADGFSTGFGGYGFLGVTSGPVGLRVLMGSDEPATRDETNQKFSSYVGQLVEVTQAIVPVELQGLYRTRMGGSPILLGAQTGIGAANITTRIKDTDARLSDTWHFGSSAAVSVGVRIWRDGILAAVGEYRHVFTSPDPTAYFDTRLELTIPVFK